MRIDNYRVCRGVWLTAVDLRSMGNAGGRMVLLRGFGGSGDVIDGYRMVHDEVWEGVGRFGFREYVRNDWGVPGYWMCFRRPYFRDSKGLEFICRTQAGYTAYRNRGYRYYGGFMARKEMVNDFGVLVGIEVIRLGDISSKDWDLIGYRGWRDYVRAQKRYGDVGVLGDCNTFVVKLEVKLCREKRQKGVIRRLYRSGKI